MTVRTSSVLLAAFGLAALGACSGPDAATLDERLKAATAAAVEGVDPATVVVSLRETTPARYSWKAQVGAAAYDCDADDKLAIPDCRPAG
jgi:hypothetical protein